jgi:hypothetical protein
MKDEVDNLKEKQGVLSRHVHKLLGVTTVIAIVMSIFLWQLSSISESLSEIQPELAVVNTYVHDTKLRQKDLDKLSSDIQKILDKLP